MFPLKCSFIAHNNTHDITVTLHLFILRFVCWVPSRSKADRIQPKSERPATRGHGTFDMLIYLASAGRATFPPEHPAQPPSLERNIAGVWQCLLAESVQTGGKRLWLTRGTTKTGKHEIQEPNTRNARYRKRTSRETRDTGTEHRGKREIQGRNITGNARHRDGTLRETRDTGTEHHEKLEMEEPSITGNMRYIKRTWQESWHTGTATDDMLFSRLLST